MGLYLCIFKEEEELDGVEVGSYSDFNSLRDFLISELESDKAGSLFPVFILHSDCDGEWSPTDCKKLQVELGEISKTLEGMPPVPFNSDWQKNLASRIGLIPKNALESFIDVDGELLIDRLQKLVELAIKKHLPILFQ